MSTAAAASQLAAAARNGDFTGALAALSSGANVHDAADDGSGWVRTPLAAATAGGHLALALHLLSLGADPSAGSAVWHAALHGSPAMVQLLVDAGGSVNGDDVRGPPLLALVTELGCDVDGTVRVLLGQPSLDITVTDGHGLCAEELARGYGMTAVAAMIRAEVCQ